MERKEAIEVIKKNWPDSSFTMLREALETVIPELRESEDERIRKEIIDYFNSDWAKEEGITRPDWIAWLEKQGNNINCVYDKELSELLHKVICRYVNAPDIPYPERENVSKKILPYVELLEKQGEQKPTDKVEPKLKIGDYVKNVNDKREPIYEIVYIDKKCYICEYRGKENIGDKAVMHFAFDYPYLRHTQNPAWSEEDENLFRCAIDAVEQESKVRTDGCLDEEVGSNLSKTEYSHRISGSRVVSR